MHLFVRFARECHFSVILMMFTSVKIMQILIIMYLIFGIWTLPIRYNFTFVRTPRQVVQPKWLAQNGNVLPTNGKVFITKDSLSEAAAVRQSIQDAVNAGTYAVELPNMTFTASSIDFSTIPQNNFYAPKAATDWNEFLAQMEKFFSKLFPATIWPNAQTKSN